MAAPDIIFLQEQAARIRRVARDIVDDQAKRALAELAAEYEARASEAEAQNNSGAS